MNNTSQIIDIGQASNYTTTLSYDDFALAVGVGIGLVVVGLLGAGVVGYWWYCAPSASDLPVEVIPMLNLNNCCFDFILDFFNLNIVYQLLIIYILFLLLIFYTYKRSAIT